MMEGTALPMEATDWSVGLDFLDGGNYIAVNRTLVRAFGLHVAVMIGELASEARYWRGQGKLRDGWFFSTVENVEGATGMNAYYQRDAIKRLRELGFVETEYKGLPRKRYFRINCMAIIQTISRIDSEQETAGKSQCFTQCTTDGALSERLDVHPVNDNNNNEQPQREQPQVQGIHPKDNYNSPIAMETTDVSFANFGQRELDDVPSLANAGAQAETEAACGVRGERTSFSCKDDKDFKPKHKYPLCYEDVLDFYKDSNDDLIQWALSLEFVVMEFIEYNDRHGWRMSGDGSPIYDWTKVFRQRCAGAWVRAVDEDDDVLSCDPDVAKARRRLLSSQKHKSGYSVDSREKARQNRRQALTAA